MRLRFPVKVKADGAASTGSASDKLAAVEARLREQISEEERSYLVALRERLTRE